VSCGSLRIFCQRNRPDGQLWDCSRYTPQRQPIRLPKRVQEIPGYLPTFGSSLPDAAGAMLRSSCSRMWVRSSSRLRRYRRQRHCSPVDRRPQKFPGLSGERRRQAIALAASRADSLARHSSVRRSRRSKCRFGFRNVCFAGSEDKRSIVESPLLFFRRGSYCCPGLEGRCEEGLHPPGPGTSRLLLPRYPSRSSPYGYGCLSRLQQLRFPR